MSTQKQHRIEEFRVRPRGAGGDADTLAEQRTDIDRMFDYAVSSIRNMSEDSQTFLRRSRQTGGQ